MKRSESIYELLNHYLDIGEEGINLLEEQIDSDTQLEYFEYSKNYKNTASPEEITQLCKLIFDTTISSENKKRILVQLASVHDVEVYRIIERYLKQSSENLYEWAYLALQESRISLESDLMETNKVLITTGLGGKGLKIRYFLVFFTENGAPFNAIQSKILLSELRYAMSRKGSEIEFVMFQDNFASVLAVVPIQIPVQQLFDKVLKECNEFGDFLFNDYIITNVKILSNEEIQEMITMNNIPI